MLFRTNLSGEFLSRCDFKSDSSRDLIADGQGRSEMNGPRGFGRNICAPMVHRSGCFTGSPLRRRPMISPEPDDHPGPPGPLPGIEWLVYGNSAG